MDRFKSPLLLFTITITINVIAHFIKSDFIGLFLKNNIISILINILAVNIATSAILMTKLNELLEKHIADFSATYSEIKTSLKEQVILIGTSFIILIIDKSIVLNGCVPHCSFYLNILLTGVFIYAIDILWDIGKAVFTIINH